MLYHLILIWFADSLHLLLVLILDLLLFEEVVTGLVLPHGIVVRLSIALLIALESGELSYLRVHVAPLDELEERQDVLLNLLVATDQQVFGHEHPGQYLVILGVVLECDLVLLVFPDEIIVLRFGHSKHGFMRGTHMQVALCDSHSIQNGILLLEFVNVLLLIVGIGHLRLAGI